MHLREFGDMQRKYFEYSCEATDRLLFIPSPVLLQQTEK